jgi:hypothetical protein
MRSFLHPYSKALYEEIGDGRARVSKDGKSGVFLADGRYVEGELTYADLHTLMWVAGPDLHPSARQSRLGFRSPQPAATGKPATGAAESEETGA